MASKQCTFADCGKPYLARGWCAGHYKQATEGRELAPLRQHLTRTGPCLFDGCDKPRRKAGLCAGHRKQHEEGRPLAPLRRRLPSNPARDDMGRKHCPECETWLPLDAYHRDKRCSEGVRNVCRACQRWRGIQSRHSLTEARFMGMYEAQSGLCASCANPVAVGLMNVDHDHACCPGAKSCGSCVRGLLCRACNVGLGAFADNLKALRGAIRYLEEGWPC